MGEGEILFFFFVVIVCKVNLGYFGKYEVVFERLLIVLLIIWLKVIF